MSALLGRIAACAVLAGILASLPLTVAQALWVTPLILQAETYEDSEAAAPADPSHAEAPPDRQAAPSPAWQPQDGWQRTLATAAGNGVLGIGHALILAGLFTLRRPLGVKQGLAWGLAGYTAFFVAPGLGLPPELPGTASADLAARQYWWLGTVLATAGGLALLFLQGRWPLRIVGVLLLAAPHVIGAPQPAVLASLAPEALQAQFRAATLAGNALFWLALGAVSAGLFRRWCAPPSKGQGARG